ncbi:MAG: acyl-CoA dehydrogenase [Pseudomonadota bacterium]
MRELFDTTVQRLFGDLATPEAVMALEAGTWPAALWDGIAESGFSLASAPEEAGGTGSDWNDLYVVVRACGRHAVPAPLPEALLANWLLGRAGLQAIEGTLTFAAASTLRIDSGHASGQLNDVPWGRHANHVVALAGDQVVLLRTADADTVALQLNMAGEPRDTLSFAHAEVLASGALPADMPADILLLGGAMLRSAQMAGALQAVLEMTVQYAGERSQFGRPIAGFQAIQHRLAVLAEQTAAAMIASEAAFAESDAQLARLAVMAAKVCASEAAGIAADTAHAVHGAIGITEEHALHLLTQRLWSWRSEFGSATYWAQQIGRDACAGGAQRYWPTITATGDLA